MTGQTERLRAHYVKLALIALASVCFMAQPGDAARIKDIVALQGLRENQLVGYGLVVGLQGSGDSLRNSAFTEQSLQSMLDRMGVSVKSGALRTKNVAAVLVTAELPQFSGRGQRIDVAVASLGDASSLMGGTLILTPLAGPDGQTYAVAQGPLAVTGFAARGETETLTQGVPTAGRIAGGAMIEREAPAAQHPQGLVVLELRNPDFRTAVAVVDAINEHARRRYGRPAARERDLRTILLTRPRETSLPRFLAEIGDLVVETDAPARVVIDARTGTIVIGQDVKISTVAVTQGAISVRVSDAPVVSQPTPYSNGQTVAAPQTTIEASENGGNVAIVGGPNLRTLVRGLNQIGLKPAGIIAILQAIKAAGALQAELVVQ